MQATAEVHGTVLLDHTLSSVAKIIVHEGSSSSSKTFSIAQAFIIWSYQEAGKTFSVVRKTMPAMKRGALKDFKDALALMGLTDDFAENKTDFRFKNNATGTVVEFFALDVEQKARGPRRDRLWCNEANELTHEDFRQLSMRTRGQIILDYNPSMLRHWIYTEVIPRPDCEHIHSTYKVNTFLPDPNRREIEVMAPVYQEADGSQFIDWDLTYTGHGQLITGDPYWWAVYGLGRRGSPAEAIYPQVFDAPAIAEGAPSFLGLDFGYNHPMVLVRVAVRDTAPKPVLIIDELFYRSFCTAEDLIALLPEMGVGRNELIYADGSRPEMIEDMKRAGYDVQGADKGPGSVKAGIDLMKRYKICFTGRSSQSRQQFQDYRWRKTPDGIVTDEPVKLHDDAPDAARYALYSHVNQPQPWLLS